MTMRQKIFTIRMDSTPEIFSGRNCAAQHARNFRAPTKTNNGACDVQLN